MKAGTLLRIGIYLVGLWALFTGTTSAVYYLHARFGGSTTTDFAGRDFFGSMVYGNAVAPLFFAFTCFGFAGRITRALLGSAADETIGSVPPAFAARILIKLLGLYLTGVFVGPLVATVYELLALRTGSPNVSEVKLTSDLIANGVGIAFGLLLVLRTDQVIAWIAKDEKA